MVKTAVFQRILCFIVCICAAMDTSLVVSQDFFIPEDEDLFIEIPSDWKEIDKPERGDVLRLLISTIKYNRGLIKTYSAKFAIDAELEDAGMSEASAVSLGNESAQSKVYRHIDFTVDVVSDVDSRTTFRNVVYNEDIFRDGTGVVKFKNEPFDTVSVTTPYEHIYFQKEMALYRLRELPDYTFQDDKFAWIVAPETLGKTGYLTLLDPFEYYSLDIWGSLVCVLDAMDGKSGADKQEFADSIVSLYETTDKRGVKWFRFCEKLTSTSDKGTSYFNILWNESSGLMPVFSSLLSDTKNDWDFIRQAKWSYIDNVYVPTEMRHALYRHDGALAHRHHMTVADVKVNEPVNREVFSLKSLGLPEGCPIVDRTKRKVYTYKKGNKVFLADFFTKPAQRSYSFMDRVSKARVFLVVLGLTMLGVGIFMRSRHKSKKLNPSISGE